MSLENLQRHKDIHFDERTYVLIKVSEVEPRFINTRLADAEWIAWFLFSETEYCRIGLRNHRNEIVWSNDKSEYPLAKRKVDYYYRIQNLCGWYLLPGAEHSIKLLDSPYSKSSICQTIKLSNCKVTYPPEIVCEQSYVEMGNYSPICVSLKEDPSDAFETLGIFVVAVSPMGANIK